MEAAAAPVGGRAAPGEGDSDGWRMPAEWEEHAGCLVAWPTRRDLWRDAFHEAKEEYAGVVDAISAFEPVTVVCAPGAGKEVARAVRADVSTIELPLDDSWIRDSGPIFVRRDGELAAVDFRFNSWGERFLPYDDDARLSERLLGALGIERHPSALVLEGGSIAVDGEGTLITTEQCLLNPNRNPGASRSEIEDELRRLLGVTTIVWLPCGGIDDRDTDGHVDGVCAFVRPGAVLVQSCRDESHPDFERMRANRAVLDAAVDARGRSFEVFELPLYPYVEVHGERTLVSHVNFYIANGGVVVPTSGLRDDDDAAIAVVGDLFPGRAVVGAPARVIGYGGGGVHCITQQIPAAPAPDPSSGSS